MRSFMVWLVALLIACGVLAGCGASRHDAHTIKVGFVPGPYRQEFEEGVAPQLKQQGYRIVYQEFSDGMVCNDALAHGEIDANVMQHRTYLNSTNQRNGTRLRALVEVPTPPMGLFSRKHSTLTPPDHAIVAVPDTAVNLLRALRIMRDAGWLSFNEQVSPDAISPQDVTANPHHLKLLQLDAAQGPRALEDADYAAIQGNFVISAGLELKKALALERPAPGFINVVAVDQKNLHKPFAKAIAAAYRSPDFRHAIEENPDFDGYMAPDYFSP